MDDSRQALGPPRLPTLFCTRVARLGLTAAASAALMTPLIAPALAQAGASAFAVTSRELVDVQFTANGDARVLLSAPGAPAPGLYAWSPRAAAPTPLCTLAAPAAFSFDRRRVIERQYGAPAQVRVYDVEHCRLLARVPVADGVAVDADASRRYIAVAVRHADGTRRLRLHNFRGRLLASTPVSANVEIGFAADGRSLLNFDLGDRSDDRSGAWTLPELAVATLPAWATGGEASFVPGTGFVKRYQDEALALLRWPDGRAMHTVAAGATTRLRALSASGRFGLLHERRDSEEALDWMDFATGKRLSVVRAAAGSIDHAALSADGRQLIWAQRSPDGSEHRVALRRSGIGQLPVASPAAAATPPGGTTPEADRTATPGSTTGIHSRQTGE